MKSEKELELKTIGNNDIHERIPIKEKSEIFFIGRKYAVVEEDYMEYLFDIDADVHGNTIATAHFRLKYDGERYVLANSFVKYQQAEKYNQNLHHDLENKYSVNHKNKSGMDVLNENTYLLSANHEFYKKTLNNPIDRKYAIDEDASSLEILQSALKKCKAWNRQIVFTGSKLKKKLSKDSYVELQDALRFWHEYYQEEVDQNRELYGSMGLISGSMYTAISADILIEKCKLVSFSLLSEEYELTGNVSFAEKTKVENKAGKFSPTPQTFCIEYNSDFQKQLDSYSLNEKNTDELEKLIYETADKIEERFGHDFVEHSSKYVSFVHSLYMIENKISENRDLCLIVQKNRLKLYETELLNILYMCK